MVSIVLPNFNQGLIGSILFYALYSVYWQLTVGASRRAFIKKHGCKPIKNTPELNSFPNNVFGIKVLRENLQGVKAHNVLDVFRGRFLRNGYTNHSKVLFTDLMQTVESENVKTMLALNFKDWSLGDRRKDAFTPLLGHGIFTTDGAAWQRSRELLRPNFVRSQVGDLATFEIHVSQMIKAIPRDGSTVNLQDLFFKLTMDSATEFLFGESTNCLSPGRTAEKGMEFAEAFGRSQECISESFRSGKLADWLRGSSFKNDVRYVQDFVDHFVRKGLEYRKTLDLSKGPPELDEGERYVFLNELVKSTADPIQIRAELLNILLAGRDTTASLLSDVWFVLARRPDIWAKLKAEVEELGGEKPTYQQIKDMKYLRMVLNECKTFNLVMRPRASLTISSIAALPRRPRELAPSRRRHRPPPRRRPRWKIPPLHPQGQSRPVVPLHHASTSRLLRRRRRGIQAREMGIIEARLGRSRPQAHPLTKSRLDIQFFVMYETFSADDRNFDSRNTSPSTAVPESASASSSP